MTKAAPFGIWDWDLSSSALQACDRAREVFGLAPGEEATLENLRRATHPDDRGFDLEGLERALDPQRRTSCALQWRAARPDGGFRWVRADVRGEFAATEQAPRVLRYFGTVQDIEDEKLPAVACRDAKRWLALALEAGRMAIWDYDVVLEKLVGSAELNELLGFAPEDAPSMEDLRVGYPPGEHERMVQAAHEASARGDRAFELVYRYRRRDGKMRWMLLRAEFVLGPEQEIERILGVLADVTYRQAADETNAYLAAVVSSSADAIVTFDRAGDILTWNEAAERIFGYSQEEAIGGPFAMAFPSGADLSRLERVWAGEGIHFEGETQRKDASAFHASVTAAPVRAPNGRIVSVVVTVRDATARKNNERRQSLLVRELHHRVRNTLATVQAIAGASARYAHSLDEFRETFSQRIGSLAQAHALLTEDNWQSVDLGRLMLLELKPYADLDRITLSGPETVLDARTAIPIGMAVHELTTNAVKHGALSTRSGRIDISWSVFGAGAERRIELLWSETGGPRAKRPSRRGFGSLLLHTILKMQLGAQVDVEYAPEGLRFTLRAALQEPTR